MRHRKTGLFFIILLSGFSGAGPVLAVGISTTFADVVLKDVSMGQSTSVHDQTGRDLVLKNLGSAPIDVRIEALIPSQQQLKENARAIPDVGWISIMPPVLEIPAFGQGECHLKIQVPVKRAYKGKRYQVMIWSHSETPKGGGVSFNAGLLSRLRFSVKKK